MRKFLSMIVEDRHSERHPICTNPPDATIASLVSYCYELQCMTALLWDQVWWMNLPWWKRSAFRMLGFNAPIKNFYMRS